MYFLFFKRKKPCPGSSSCFKNKEKKSFCKTSGSALQPSTAYAGKYVGVILDVVISANCQRQTYNKI